jgi:hypothetical protein
LEDYDRVLKLIAQDLADTKDPVERIALQDEESRLQQEKAILKSAESFLQRFV